jgi:hypothetical protein
MYPLISIVVTAVLIAGIFELPIWYYDILRVAISVYSGVNVYLYFKERQRIMATSFFVLGILFNPILKIEMAKEAWIVFDIIAAIITFISGFYYYIKYCGKLQQK